MLSFKPKSNKKIKFNKKSTVTIDTKHNEFLYEFSQDEDIILEYKAEIHNIKKKLKEENETLSLEEKLEFSDKILELKDIIKKTQNKKKDYLLENSKYIFEYFENKKNISSSVKSNQINTNKSKTRNLLFLMACESTKTLIVFITLLTDLGSCTPSSLRSRERIRSSYCFM
jgi:hypothetical protein